MRSLLVFPVCLAAGLVAAGAADAQAGCTVEYNRARTGTKEAQLAKLNAYLGNCPGHSGNAAAKARIAELRRAPPPPKAKTIPKPKPKPKPAPTYYPPPSPPPSLPPVSSPPPVLQREIALQNDCPHALVVRLIYKKDDTGWRAPRGGLSWSIDAGKTIIPAFEDNVPITTISSEILIHVTDKDGAWQRQAAVEYHYGTEIFGFWSPNVSLDSNGRYRVRFTCS